MAKSDPSIPPSALPNSFPAASSPATASSAAISTVSTSTIASSTIPSSSTASSTIASSAASASPTALANQVDNHINPGGIAAASVFGCAILLSCIYLAYLAYQKLQTHRQHPKSFSDQEHAPLAAASPTARLTSHLKPSKLPHDDVIEIVVHRPEQPESANALLRTPTPSTTSPSPRPSGEIDPPRRSPSPASPTRPPLLAHTQYHPQRQSAPLPSNKLFPFLPAPPARNSYRPSYARSPPLPIWLPPLAATSNPTSRSSTPATPSARSLSPTSSTALLTGLPATHGRPLSEGGPRLDAECVFR
ncbi:hypothetical protein MMC32_004346 [Xylographa parallela]|nr:hypothetical protein [Xylographa parallela]